MNILALTFLIVASAAILVVPRRLATIPLLASACYMTTGQGIDLGPISLPIYRMVLAAGVLRILLRREAPAGPLNAIDKLVIAWSAWVLFASLYHVWEPGSGPVYASGYVFNISVAYFLVRIWCRGPEECVNLIKAVALLLVPVAAAMVLEHTSHRNIFSVFGGVPEGVYFRDGAIRSQGPFQHPILAGTVGAVCFPLMLGIWARARIIASIGLAACMTMTIASASSGPLMSLMFGIAAVSMWQWRSWMRVVRYGALCAYLLLELVMSRPAYYIISKIDLTGSSTGWHRSRLIEASIDHLSEWWLFGTDRTVHWMGISNWNDRHADITNYYISIGVVGGLAALLLVVFMLGIAFSWVGRLVRQGVFEVPHDRFVVWCLGAGLFAHAVTSLSTAYFDQSVVFFWLNVSTISALYSTVTLESQEAQKAKGSRVRAKPMDVDRNHGRNRIRGHERLRKPRI
jgi:hypothetical protein